MARSTNSQKSPVGIARYCNVFTPRARKGKDGKPDGEPKYSILLVFDKRTDMSDMEEIVEAAAVEKFGSKAKADLAKGKLKSPIRDAEDYVDEEASDEENYPFNLPGATMIRFSTKDKPGVVDADADPIMEKSDLYDGCKVRVSFNARGYENSGNKGVTFYLNNVQKVSDGRKLSGTRTSAEEDFAEEKPKSKAKRNRRDEDADDLL
jgi:hypothetical protein